MKINTNHQLVILGTDADSLSALGSSQALVRISAELLRKASRSLPASAWHAAYAQSVSADRVVRAPVKRRGGIAELPDLQRIEHAVTIALHVSVGALAVESDAASASLGTRGACAIARKQSGGAA